MSSVIPSANEITYFLEVAETLNLSRAAERLGISQPSLSLAIQRLEQSIGVPILLRSKKGVTLTQAGRTLLQHSRGLQQAWEEVITRAVKSQDEVTGRFTIGCHPSVARYSIGHFLPDFLEANPDIEVSLVHDLSRRIVESVISMRVDLGIVVNPARHNDLIIKKLASDEVTFWVGGGSRSIQDYKSSKSVLVCDPDLAQTQELLKKVQKAGIKVQRVVKSSNLEVIADLVAEGAGIGILPSRVAENAKKPLHRIRNAPAFIDEIALVYRMEQKDVRAVQALSSAIVASFKS